MPRKLRFLTLAVLGLALHDAPPLAAQAPAAQRGRDREAPGDSATAGDTSTRARSRGARERPPVTLSALSYIETAGGHRSLDRRDILRWTHARLVFSKDLDRIAVGHESILQVDLLNSREVLLLGREVGRTSLIAWFTDGTDESYIFLVTEDLSVLRRALRDIHPDIDVDAAPDRAALVLRGIVPDISYSHAAETAARAYLGAPAGGGLAQPVVRERKAETPAAGAEDSPSREAPVVVPEEAKRAVSPVAIINLIRVLNLPPRLEEKIRQAVAGIGGEGVQVRRVLKGDLADDLRDTLILEGQVANQVTLIRVLNVAARVALGGQGGPQAIEVLADEGGGTMEGGAGARDRGGFGFLGSTLLGVGGQTGLALGNDIRTNLGRAKLLSVAGGRILSLLKVRDVPQVRVQVQVHEINRQKLKDWSSAAGLVTGGYKAASFFAPNRPKVIQGDASSRFGYGGYDVANALQLVSGALTNQFQIGSRDVALDALFSLLEEEGISRNLSRPTLTVLSGERAVFQVGGQVPVPYSLSTGLPGGGSGVFGGVGFQAFGIQLAVRPLVDEDDYITLDVSPVVVDPDTHLTSAIVATTGSPAVTTAFRTRALETSARVRDGQPLVIGGLVSRDKTEDNSYVPGLHRIPLVGWFSKAMHQADTDTELVIVVSPSIVRDRIDGYEVWEFPSYYELLSSAVAPGMPRRPQVVPIP